MQFPDVFINDVTIPGVTGFCSRLPGKYVNLEYVNILKESNQGDYSVEQFLYTQMTVSNKEKTPGSETRDPEFGGLKSVLLNSVPSPAGTATREG